MSTPRDLVVEAGKLWDAHVAQCPRCEQSTPGCVLGAAMHAVYETAANQEGKR
jgi:hypothetical protein